MSLSNLFWHFIEPHTQLSQIPKLHIILSNLSNLEPLSKKILLFVYVSSFERGIFKILKMFVSLKKN